ncbi:MAG TPA: hypothetical protein VEQ37_18025 [Actinomycetota bacterium]|nr:hypothetical protein [Actinomycetota bacterium]
MKPEDQDQDQDASGQSDQDAGTASPPEETFFEQRDRAIAGLHAARRDDLADWIEFNVVSPSDLLEGDAQEKLSEIGAVEHYGSFIVGDFEPHITKAREVAEAEAAALRQQEEDSITAKAREELEKERAAKAEADAIAAAKQKILDDEAEAARAAGIAVPAADSEFVSPTLQTAIDKFDEVTVTQVHPVTGKQFQVAAPGHLDQAHAAATEAIRLAEEEKVGSKARPVDFDPDQWLSDWNAKLKEGK